MSKRKKHPKTQEERRLLARSQMADSSATLLRAASGLATTLGFESASLTSEFPIAAARLTDGDITVEFLYGPSEFHVEMFLSHRRYPKSRLGLSELIQHPPILAWMQAWATNRPAASANRIESEVSYFSELLCGPCAEAFTAPEAFFNRFPSNDRSASMR
jgi:hypothetical protein